MRTGPTGNRIICDWIHRGIEPRRLALLDRIDPTVNLEEMSG